MLLATIALSIAPIVIEARKVLDPTEDEFDPVSDSAYCILLAFWHLILDLLMYRDQILHSCAATVPLQRRDFVLMLLFYDVQIPW